MSSMAIFSWEKLETLENFGKSGAPWSWARRQELYGNSFPKYWKLRIGKNWQPAVVNKRKPRGSLLHFLAIVSRYFHFVYFLELTEVLEC